MLAVVSVAIQPHWTGHNMLW